MIPFGASDHNLIGYTRYSKLPPQPSTTIRKRSYKNFDKNKFISDLNRFDWTDVYTCFDINAAVEMLTLKINTILDIHAPWVMYQKRKHHAPWLSNDTLKLMSERDKLKALAAKLSSEGLDASAEWVRFKSIRNRINNRRKYEEKHYKSEKLDASLDSTADTWKVAKSFMSWSSTSGPL